MIYVPLRLLVFHKIALSLVEGNSRYLSLFFRIMALGDSVIHMNLSSAHLLIRFKFYVQACLCNFWVGLG